MKKKILIIILTITILTSSCTRIMMRSYGVKNPRIETKQSITNYLNSQDLGTQDSYAFRDTAALYKFFSTKIGFPEIIFFDKNGYLMLYRDEKKCNGQNSDLISFLNPQNLVKIDSTQNLSNIIDDIRTLDGQAVRAEDFKDHDFYLITYWAKWSGKTNKKKIADWEKTLQIKNDPKIKSIKVSIDYMDFWNIEKEDMFKIYSRKTKTTGKKKDPL